MTHEQAVALLDKVRDGALYPPYVIDFALMMTGDLSGETEEIVWQMPAGKSARGWGGYVPDQVDVRDVLGTARLGI